MLIPRIQIIILCLTSSYFQEKRGDREIENIFGILERVSELRYATDL